MRILLAFDDSKCSAAAAQTVRTQFKPEGTEVLLLHVVEAFPVSLAKQLGSRESPDFVAARVAQREQVKTLLARPEKELRLCGFKVAAVIKEGEARRVILDQAEKWKADLIVVGSHGRKGMDRFLLGSVSEAVARHARCSVQIVRIRSGK
jgi:nucleotide-binding universal stress UspA family protein